MEASLTPPADEYPVTLAVDREEEQSRLTNFPFLGDFIRIVLLIPNLIVLLVLSILAWVVYFIATFAILFTGNYPRGMFNFSVGVLRWGLAINAYMQHLTDTYPGFSMEDQPAISFDVAYPDGLNRLTNFPLIGFYIKALLLIPSLIVAYFLSIVAYLLIFIAEFAILFTGSFPRGMHGFVSGTLRWNIRIQCYLLALTDRYPPFSMS
jgi:hypothetical protein